jgi:hypothetical protein
MYDATVKLCPQALSNRVPFCHNHSFGILGNRSAAVVHVGRIRVVGDGHCGSALGANCGGRSNLPSRMNARAARRREAMDSRSAALLNARHGRQRHCLGHRDGS